MQTLVRPELRRDETPAPRLDGVTPAGPSPSPPRWYQRNGADFVFLVVGLLVFLTARQGLLDDPGLGWHLRNIDAMLERGGWLTEDPFTEPQGGAARAWYSNQWLGEIPFWLGERWAGREGVAAVAALVLAFTIRCLYVMLRRDGCPWPLAVFWVSQAAMGVSCSWVARPNLFTLFFVLVTARVSVLYHEGRCRRRTTLWLLPVFALWANMHGGFLAGFALLGTTILVEAALAIFSTEQEGRRAARQRGSHLLLLLGGTFLATLLNPYGLALYHWFFQLLGDPFFMDLHQEWRSPDFHGKGAIRFEWLMLLFPLVLALSRRRPHLVELALSVLWLHFALTGFRYVSLWVVIAVPLMARCGLEVPRLKHLAQMLNASGGGDPLSVSPLRSWVGGLLVVVAMFAAARIVEGRLARHQPDILPEDALNRFLAVHSEWRQTHGRRPAVFHSYDWGGYLTWHGGRDFRNWIDDRNEVQGREHIQDYFRILETQPGWDAALDRDGIQLICIQSNAPLTFRLSEHAGWRVLYRDSWAVIFERQDVASR